MYNVYLVSSGVNGQKLYKIGYTRRDVWDRIREFKTGNASQFEIVDVYNSKWGTKIERHLHTFYKVHKVDGEWFNLTIDQLKDFRRICEISHNNFELVDKYNTYVIDRGGLSKIKF
jgi:Meiotically up-regulated gene 113